MKRKTEKDCKSSHREHHRTNNTLRRGFAIYFDHIEFKMTNF